MATFYKKNGTKNRNIRIGGFLEFILKTNYNSILFLSLFLGGVYFIALRIIYPVPTFNNDSYSWVYAAKNHLAVTYRPILYSIILRLFNYLHHSDLPLIAAQYFTNLFSNLFLFFTCCYFFKTSRLVKIILFGFLIVHPYYLLSSNYVMSDPFFNGLAVLWFALLIWILRKPSFYIILFQLGVLAILFLLRYNAIIFPIITIVALFISQLSLAKKIAYAFVQFIITVTLVFFIINVNKKHTGVSSFSNFGGWQLANDAMVILRNKKVDTLGIKDEETKKIIRYVAPILDTTKDIPNGATAYYFDRLNSPLQRYMFYSNRDSNYFNNWNAIGPVYERFGKTIILQNPYSYLKYFVKPNTTAYLIPPLEAYNNYNQGVDTIKQFTQEYFHYKSNIIHKPNPIIYSAVFAPIPYLFMLINLSLIVFIFFYYKNGVYKSQSRLFNQSLLCFIALYLANCLFVIPLAPTVLRYHNFILTLGLLFTLLLSNTFSIRKESIS